MITSTTIYYSIKIICIPPAPHTQTTDAMENIPTRTCTHKTLPTIIFCSTEHTHMYMYIYSSGVTLLRGNKSHTGTCSYAQMKTYTTYPSLPHTVHTDTH